MQCIGGVVIVYCVSVHVFVHGAKKQTRKGVNEDNKPTGIKMIGVPIMASNPLPSACESTVQSPATAYVLIGGNIGCQHFILLHISIILHN